MAHLAGFEPTTLAFGGQKNCLHTRRLCSELNVVNLIILSQDHEFKGFLQMCICANLCGFCVLMFFLQGIGAKFGTWNLGSDDTKLC